MGDLSTGIGVSETFIADLSLSQSPARSTMGCGNKYRGPLNVFSTYLYLNLRIIITILLFFINQRFISTKKHLALSKSIFIVFPMQPYTISELSRFYGKDLRTFKKWIAPIEDEIGDKDGRLYNIKQVIIIFNYFGHPNAVK